MKYAIARFFLVSILLLQVVGEIELRTMSGGQHRYEPFNYVQFNLLGLISMSQFAMKVFAFIALLLAAVKIRSWKPIILRLILGTALVHVLVIQSYFLWNIKRFNEILVPFDFINSFIFVLPILFAFLLSLAFKDGEDKRINFTSIAEFSKRALKWFTRIHEIQRVHPNMNNTLITDIQKLHELLQKGVITDEEFTAAKKRILGS